MILDDNEFKRSEHLTIHKSTCNFAEDCKYLYMNKERGNGVKRHYKFQQREVNTKLKRVYQL